MVYQFEIVNKYKLKKLISIFLIMEIYLNNYYILQNIAFRKRLEITVLDIIKEC